MPTGIEIGGDKQTIEGTLNHLHGRLKSYTNDQITILDDVTTIVESFYKTEKHACEKMQGSLQKSLEHTQSMPYLGQSVIGSSWTAAVKDLIEHYTQREATYPLIKQVVVETLRKIRNEKVDEHSKVLFYDEEVGKEMADVERRTLKAKRAYEEAYERLRQHQNPVKEKESGIKRLHQKIMPKNELERLELAVVDTRNMYILHVQQLNYALKFYVEQFTVDIDKLLVCDLFSRIETVIDDLVSNEYKYLHDTLQCAIHMAAQDGDEQKRLLLSTTFHQYPLLLQADQSDQINTEDKHVAQLSSAYQSALGDVRDADQKIQQALESSILNAQQNRDSRIDAGKIQLKRMEMRKSMASFIVETLESVAPAVKTAQPPTRVTQKIIGGLKPFISSSKPESASSSATVPPVESTMATSSASVYPCQATVLYDFEGTTEDEMSIRKGDKIFIESKPDYDGWLVAKGRDRSGLIPEAYVQLVAPTVTTFDKDATNRAIMDNRSAMSSSSPSAATEADYFSDD